MAGKTKETPDTLFFEYKGEVYNLNGVAKISRNGFEVVLTNFAGYNYLWKLEDEAEAISVFNLIKEKTNTEIVG